MKKILLVASLVLGGFAANAQSEFKPAKGDVTTEFGLSGGVSATSFNLNEGLKTLKGRYFFQDKMAIRLGFGLNSESVKENVYTATAGQVGTTKENTTSLLLNLGIEKHFTGTDRLSPYVGADLTLGYDAQETTWENQTAPGSAFVDKAKGDSEGPTVLGLGLRGVIGADYYFTKRVFLGVEGTFGFVYSKEGKVKTNNTTAAGVTTSSTVESPGSEFTVAPKVNAGVRIGFVF